ncbi:uncharacterized protein PITG_04486 [Phytophthora infestans T30-4]|uniref:RRM domain-containing protein n=1 Tax=Phytophthora infestans (strain T30-4) TaxID=403677 RepID=D0N1D5_PHYIT|nr:uncharacterized protein PITG_04486 [Phytophthora infestans T30-4]EEY67448.1 conserved hypothetical protein [Phytophthora infestans T30-4]|eukprot:XP_002906096.1 conserved hypothetical protein [Phytophthora infestans T30-4]
MGGEEQALAATEEACRVYVGNLLPKAKEIHLTNKLARFGTIHSPPGFAFVRFASPDAAKRVVDACQGEGSMEILGKAVRVQMAGGKDRKSAEQQQQQRRAAITIGGEKTAALNTERGPRKLEGIITGVFDACAAVRDIE